MICHSIKLENFRNIPIADVPFCDGINLILGNNAQGKTNLLEAVALMAIGKSFRGAKDAEMIRFGAVQSSITLSYHDSVRTQTVAVHMDTTHRRLWLQNDVKVPRVADMVGQFRVVIFLPEHLSIIKSGPELRRNFLDIALCQSRPLYLHALQRYNGILKERNKLLKQAQEEGMTLGECDDMLDVWTDQLAGSAAIITQYRTEFVEKMNLAAADIFREMTNGRETPEFIYKGILGYGRENLPDEYGRHIYNKMSDAYAREIAAGVTLHGTHRDDIEIYLNGKSARLYASQGQQRSLALAMKLAEGEISRELHRDYPVFLFDDVLSELDRGRREYLLSRIEGKQVMMSGCESIEAVTGSTKAKSVPHRVISVENGNFEWKE